MSARRVFLNWQKVLVFGIVLALSVIATQVMNPDNASAAGCDVNTTPNNIFPRNGLGAREEYGCAAADSYLWLSDYYTTSGGGSTLQTPYHRLRIFYPMTYVNAFPAGGQIDSIAFYSPDGNRVHCGINVTATYLQTGATLNWQKGAGCSWPTFLGFIPGSFAIIKEQVQQDTARYGDNLGYVDVDLRMTSNNTSMPVKIWATQTGTQARITFREQTKNAAETNQPSPNPDGTNSGGGDGDIGPDGGSIAIWTNDVGDVTERISYNLGFTPDCTVNAGDSITIYLKWYDADADYPATPPTQDPGFGWEVIDDTNGTVVASLFDDAPPNTQASRIATLGGNDSYRTRAVTLTGGHKYRWRWSGIRRNNGIQIWMPFSEVLSDPLAACPPAADPQAGHCSIALTSPNAKPEPGEIFSIRVFITDDGTNLSPRLNSTTNPVFISAPGVSGLSPGTYIYSIANPGDTDQVNDGGLTAAVGVHTITASVPSVGFSCTFDITVATRTYFKAFGGDVWAGGGFLPGSCAPPVATPSGRIIGMARPDGAGYAGSSAQFSVTALLRITEFYSASNRGTFSATNPGVARGLTFANTNSLFEYGGNYDIGMTTGRCFTDYYNATRNSAIDRGNFNGTNLPPQPPSATNGLGQYDLVPPNNNANISGPGPLTIPAGRQVAVYHEGNVFITRNIVLGGTTDSYFALIVKGNIYIHFGVTRIDGLIVAQPDPVTGTGGIIYDCASAANTPILLQNLYNQCPNGLAFNGSVVAKQLKLMRMKGTLRNATFQETVDDWNTGNDADISEVFNYNPNMYLAPSPLKIPGATDTEDNIDNSQMFDSLKTLPPIY